MCQSRLECKKAQIVSSKQVHNITDGPLDIEYQLSDVHTSSSSLSKTTLQVEGQKLAMEIDTVAAVSLVSEEPIMKDLPLVPTDVSLRTYMGEAVPVFGKLMVNVRKDEAQVTLPLLVDKGGSITLLGRDWLQKLKLDWKNIFKLHSTLSLQQVLDCHESVFADELGTFNWRKMPNPNSPSLTISIFTVR